MISGKKRAISWNEIAHDESTLLYSLQLIIVCQLRILKSKKRDVFEKKESILKVSKKDVAFNVS